MGFSGYFLAGRRYFLYGLNRSSANSHVLQSIRVMKSSRTEGEDEHGLTPFQAFVTGLASRVGVGNIAGVAIAIAIGGPGAVFWMWVTAVLGMSSAFIESTLAQLLR